MARVDKLILMAVTAMCSAVLPTAHAADPEQARRVEFTLLGGYRFGGALQEASPTAGTSDSLVNVQLGKGAAYGFAVNWEAEPDSMYEVAYSRQTTPLNTAAPFDMTVEYLHIGGYVVFAEPTARVIPYFRLTVGAARFAPQTSGLETLIKPSAAVGGGVIVPFTSHVAMRFDGRLNATFFQGQQDVFCRSGDTTTCSIHLQGGTLVQPELSLGFTFGF